MDCPIHVMYFLCAGCLYEVVCKILLKRYVLSDNPTHMSDMMIHQLQWLVNRDLSVNTCFSLNSEYFLLF